MIKLAAVEYKYLQDNGKFKKRNSVCASNEVEIRIARLQKDPKAKDIKQVVMK